MWAPKGRALGGGNCGEWAVTLCLHTALPSSSGPVRSLLGEALALRSVTTECLAHWLVSGA